MWRLYASTAGLVRLEFSLDELIDAFDRATLPVDAKLYVGRVLYTDAATLRREVTRIESATLTVKGVANEAMRAILLKRIGFEYENEVRFCYALDNVASPNVRARATNISSCVQELLIDPYLEIWQAAQLKYLFKKQLRVPFTVGHSKFNRDPSMMPVS